MKNDNSSSLISRVRAYLGSEKPSAKNNLLEKSEVFCMAPWVHLHVATKGQIFPCCISAHYLEDAIGNAKVDSLEASWNSDKMKQLRRNMLEGKRSNLCKLCYQYQGIDEQSPRHDFNNDFGHHFPLVGDTKPDGTFESFELKTIDFRFSNLCNFRCRICSHHFSTSWFSDAIEVGTAKIEDGRLIVPVENPEELWEQMVPILPHLERIHFAGGEPLIMEEHYRILMFFIENKMSHVQLSYNTNFSEIKFKGQDVFELWKNFDHLSICASLDGMGPRGEFMRKGQNWKQTVDNRKRMLKECPHVGFMLTPAVSIMNVLHLPDFYQNWVEQGLIKPKEIMVYIVFEPDFFNIQDLPYFFKKRIQAKYQLFFDNCLSTFDEESKQYALLQFNRILDHMNEVDKFQSDLESYNQQTFTSYNSTLDQLRNEDIVKVFPELEDLYN